MLMKNALAALLGLTLAAEAATVHHYRTPTSGTLVRRQNKQNGGGRGGNQRGGGGGQQNNDQNNQQGGNNQNNNNNNQAGSATCLAANAVQTGSQQTGQNGQVADGQVESAVDQANFINFCAGKDLTNGFQKRGGSCNGIVMGDIPSVENMVSTVILEPGNFQDLAVGQTFTIRLNVANLNLGAFTNATSTYYSSPAQLAGNGRIIGHTHVTVQDTGNSLNPQTPLDAKQFVFFKGINDAGNGQGLVQTDVTGGLPAGNYRVCTMSSAANHQPVLMPVAQRGSQEDCKYFTVGQGNQQNGGANNNNNNNNNNNDDAANNDNDQQNGGAQNGGAQNGGAQNGGAQNGGAQNGGAQNGGAQNGGAQNGGAQNGGAQNGGAQNGGAQNGGAQDGGAQNGGAQNGGAQNGGGAQNNGGGAQNNGGGQGKGKGGGGRGGGRGGQQANNAGAQNGGAQNNGGGAQNNNGGAAAGGAVGGIAAPAVEDSGNADRPFKVGENTFVNREAAVQRSCAIQNNACSDAVNRGQVQGVSTADCNAQEQACRNAA